MSLPPCGLYRTRAPVGDIPAGKLVSFHNHGDPGPGVYLPASWKHNRAQFRDRGFTLPDATVAAQLEPLPAEGLYRVTGAFYCCAKLCRKFEPDTLVQLGYNADAQAILFTPELVDGMLAIPTSGTAIDPASLPNLKALKVATGAKNADDLH